MKKISSKIISFIFVCGVFAFTSCGSTSKMKTRTIESLISDVWITSSKDSVQDCGKFYTTPEIGRFKTLEVEFKKDSGCEDSCFGLVFGYSSQNMGICTDYIRFEINTLGEYAVYSYDGKTYHDLVNDEASNTAYYLQSSSIVKGLGSQNKLKVEVAGDGTYSCYINGNKVASGIKPLENGTKGIMAFFSVGTAGQEKLPDTPVQVSYRITAFDR